MDSLVHRFSSNKCPTTTHRQSTATNIETETTRPRSAAAALSSNTIPARRKRSSAIETGSLSHHRRRRRLGEATTANLWLGRDGDDRGEQFWRGGRAGAFTSSGGSHVPSLSLTDVPRVEWDPRRVSEFLSPALAVFLGVSCGGCVEGDMSSAVGEDLPGSKDMGLDQKSEKAEQNGILTVREGEREGKSEHGRPGGEGEGLDRQMSEISRYATEEEEEEEEEEDGKGAKGLDLGPQVSIKDQLEKDKVLASIPFLVTFKPIAFVSVSSMSLKFGFPVLHDRTEYLEPEVTILCLSIISPGRADIVLPLPTVPNSKGVWFTLKEGSPYKLKFSFSVSNNIVSGLRYINTVWKTGVKC
ncbi:hypothetical protein BHM03_00044071 [Ensete ventricosum]|nr:hypothetical protein BHM03_00044071 [Ensete ventricosum]